MYYFDWLQMIVIPDGEKRIRYSKLMRILMNEEFAWSVQRDENRARDGLELRDIYQDETGEDCDVDGPCSILEMLVALSIRCNDELMYDPDDPKRADRWFWMILEASGVAVFENSFIQKQTPCDDFSLKKEILSKMVDENGRWCLFLKKKRHPKIGEIELWYQLNHYIMWRFGANFG